MTKNLLILILIFSSFHGIAQDNLEIDSEVVIDKYNSMSVLNAFALNDSIICLAARLEISQTDRNKLGIFTIHDRKIISETIISPEEFVAFREVINHNNQFIVLGSVFTDNDFEQDYLASYDEKGNCNWTLKLEKKYEGIFDVTKFSTGLVAISSGTEGLFRYEINNKGEMFSKQKVPTHGYYLDAITSKAGKTLIVSIILNEKGETENWNLYLFDSELKLDKQISIELPDKFFAKKVIEYKNGFLIAGEEEGKYAAIPKCYFFDENLEMINIYSFHYQPAHYKFKSNFRINDVVYDELNETFVASGITNVVNDETNILILLDEYSMLNHKLLDKSAGIWKNNDIIINSNNQIVFIGDSKKQTNAETKIKMINFK